MNLLFYRYGSICEPDIIEGFRELGNQVTEITLEIYNKNLGPLEGLTALKNELFAHSYDFVFSINYYPFISEICNIFQIRYLCWTVDCPVIHCTQCAHIGGNRIPATIFSTQIRFEIFKKLLTHFPKRKIPTSME